MSRTRKVREDADEVEVRQGRRAPFTQVADWVALAPIKATSTRAYWMLAAHTNTGSSTVFASLDALAELLGYSRRDKVVPFLRELERLGAIDIETVPVPGGGTRRRCIYTVHETPPEGYTGHVGLTGFYAERNERIKAEKARRAAEARAAAEAAAPPVLPLDLPTVVVAEESAAEVPERGDADDAELIEAPGEVPGMPDSEEFKTPADGTEPYPISGTGPVPHFGYRSGTPFRVLNKTKVNKTKGNENGGGNPPPPPHPPADLTAGRVSELVTPLLASTGDHQTACAEIGPGAVASDQAGEETSAQAAVMAEVRSRYPSRARSRVVIPAAKASQRPPEPISAHSGTDTLTG